MRLTLRTLMAYLDNTLDSQDAEALKMKLSESSFATQLVQRIRQSLSNQMLSAPLPDAVGPVEDANAISEYLDSTLSTEQVSEIERACLESDPHLAEAAACHQILTMVLGTPANVSAELRQRIYELPDRSIEEIAAGGNVSSLVVPDEASPIGPWADAVPTADATLNPDQPVEPVGVTDSGVADAPTRLRQMEGADIPMSPSVASARSAVTIAGSKPRSITDSEIYGGSIRPSRITPWLVSLAVAAILLFALAQIFAPLLGGNKRVADAGVEQTTDAESEASADPPEIAVDVPAAATTDSSTDTVAAETSDPTAAASAAPQASADATTSTSDSSEDWSPISKAPRTDDTPPATSAINTTDDASDDSRPAGEPTADDTETAISEPQPESSSTATGSDTTGPPESEGLSVADSPVPPVADDQPADELADADTTTKDRIQIAQVASTNALIATMSDDQWTALARDAAIDSGTVVVCAPTFRGEMVTADQMLTTMIGPTRVRWESNDGGKQLHLESGRLLLAPGEPESTITMVLADQAVTVTFADAAHVAAVQVTHVRQPGFDPLVEENHIPIRAIAAVQGSITISGQENNEPVGGTLETGQQWVLFGDEEPRITDLEEYPVWVEQPDESDLSLEANARKGLLDLLADRNQSFEIALREATSFRQSEVAALAGQTLLALRRGDVYFDAVGILNQPKQRAYWPDHYLALRGAINEGVETAHSLYDSIQRMDAANGKAIMRLLAGYSQQQLIDGGDQELVEMLDSPSMAVRVLALENLREITGTTLYFRAEQDNAVRRTQGIKKWVTRRDRGDIRWPE